MIHQNDYRMTFHYQRCKCEPLSYSVCRTDFDEKGTYSDTYSKDISIKRPILGYLLLHTLGCFDKYFNLFWWKWSLTVRRRHTLNVKNMIWIWAKMKRLHVMPWDLCVAIADGIHRRVVMNASPLILVKATVLKAPPSAGISYLSVAIWPSPNCSYQQLT